MCEGPVRIVCVIVLSVCVSALRQSVECFGCNLPSAWWLERDDVRCRVSRHVGHHQVRRIAAVDDDNLASGSECVQTCTGRRLQRSGGIVRRGMSGE